MKVDFIWLTLDTSESVFRDQAVLSECMACRDGTTCAGRGTVRERVGLWAVQHRRPSASPTGQGGCSGEFGSPKGGTLGSRGARCLGLFSVSPLMYTFTFEVIAFGRARAFLSSCSGATSTPKVAHRSLYPETMILPFIGSYVVTVSLDSYHTPFIGSFFPSNSAAIATYRRTGGRWLNSVSERRCSARSCVKVNA